VEFPSEDEYKVIQQTQVSSQMNIQLSDVMEKYLATCFKNGVSLKRSKRMEKEVMKKL